MKNQKCLWLLLLKEKKSSSDIGIEPHTMRYIEWLYSTRWLIWFYFPPNQLRYHHFFILSINVIGAEMVSYSWLYNLDIVIVWKWKCSDFRFYVCKSMSDNFILVGECQSKCESIVFSTFCLQFLGAFYINTYRHAKHVVAKVKSRAAAKVKVNAHTQMHTLCCHGLSGHSPIFFVC